MEGHLGELWFTIADRSKVEEFSVGGPIETEDERLVDLEVDDLVETRTKFDCLVEGLKYGVGEPVSKTTSKGSSCSNPEEACNNLMP